MLIYDKSLKMVDVKINMYNFTISRVWANPTVFEGAEFADMDFIWKRLVLTN